MLIAPIISLYAVRAPMTRIIQGMHLCYAAAIFINVLFVLGTKPTRAYTGEVLRMRPQPLGRARHSPSACRALSLVTGRMVPDGDLVNADVAGTSLQPNSDRLARWCHSSARSQT
jgi:hypothetical protein